MEASRSVRLRDLRERIRTIESRGACAPSPSDRPDDSVRATGWPDLDAALGGGLAAGGLHEWLGVETAPAETASSSRTVPTARRWSPPLGILVHLARRAALDAAPRWTLWIGRTCHPYPHLLARQHGRDHRAPRRVACGDLLEHSLFVATSRSLPDRGVPDPRDAAARLWAVDLALRSPAVGCVVADGCGFDRAATQRIQFLARKQMKWVLAARPPRERSELSAAQTRWLVRIELSPAGTVAAGVQPRWHVELLRCKGMRSAAAGRSWLLEWNRDTSTVDLSAALADLGRHGDRAGAAAGPAGREAAPPRAQTA